MANGLLLIVYGYYLLQTTSGFFSMINIMVRKVLFFFLLLAISCLLFATPVRAKDFSSFFKTTYDFSSSGDSSVSQEIAIVNLSPDLYVSEYTLSALGGDISKIEAYDKIGPLKVKSYLKDKTTIITLSFNEKVVGKEKVLSFILKYNIKGLAKKEGNLWQINIPKLSNKDSIDDYQLHLKIPQEFGKIAYLSPNPTSEESGSNHYLLNFNGNDLFNYGVVVTLGQYQTYNFNLSYDLSNNNSEKRREKVTIPSDTSYQTVYFQKIDPEPNKVEFDEDGNTLASFELFPKQRLTVNVQGQVNLFSKPKQNYETKNNNLDKYLAESKYWDINNSKIKKLSSELKTVNNIYKYVVNNLKYDYQSVKNNVVRKGASLALENPDTAICSEFTDLFIALARASGIPARELEGYAYTDNPVLKEISIENDLLHSWPEYFNKEKNLWIMVDPTWENTTRGLDFFNKFDMSHFVFVTHGLSDTFPFSPGSYKDKDSGGKQIFVALNNDPDVVRPKIISFEKIVPNRVYSLKQNSLQAQFKNDSGFALYTEDLLISGGDLIEPNTFKFSSIPPYSSFKVDFSLKPKEQFKDYQIKINFDISDNQLSEKIFVQSLGLRLTILFGGLISVIISLILSSVRKNKKINNNTIAA